MPILSSTNGWPERDYGCSVAAFQAGCCICSNQVREWHTSEQIDQRVGFGIIEVAEWHHHTPDILDTVLVLVKIDCLGVRYAFRQG
jgi:hypothetical protein